MTGFHDFRWPGGQQCAVSLSYDDGLPIHHQHAAPALEAAGLRGTFYVPGKSDITDNPDAWRKLAAQGHELGNHSLFHPCPRPLRYYRWLKDTYDIREYTPERFRIEIEVANLVLHLLDGKTERTYGNNCCNLTVGEGENAVPMDDIIRDLVVAARGTLTYEVIDPRQPINFMQLGHFDGDSHTADELKGLTQQALDTGGWIIFMMHGIGPESHTLNIDPGEHDAFANWLGENRDRIWTAPIVDVAQYAKAQQTIN